MQRSSRNIFWLWPFNRMKQLDGVPITGVHGVRIVYTLHDMGDLLADGSWPSDGPKFLAALSALVEERVGRCTPKNARIAFISAAIEAGVLPPYFMMN